MDGGGVIMAETMGLSDARARAADVTADETAPPAASTPSLDSITAYLDILMAGRLDTPPPVGDLEEPLRRLARHLRARARLDLQAAADLSMNASEAMAAVSFMTGDIREADARTQLMASATEQLTASIKEIAAASEAVAEKSAAARDAAAGGVSRVEEAVTGMGDINANVASIGERVEKATEASEQIGGILQLIDSLSSQTNLLALNATIEAARAGEHGRGFAVVAGEVKALANQTASATEEIRSKITVLTDEMRSLTAAMARCIEAVETGREQLDEVGGEIRSIGGEVESVSEQIGRIAENISEQTIAVNEIGKGVSAISEITERNNRNSGEAIAAVGAVEQFVAAQFARLDDIHIENAVLFRAKSDHYLWKKHLAEMLAGAAKLSADELSDHHQCRLGKWYDKVRDGALATHKSFSALIEPHAEVHLEGKRAAAAYAEGRREDAKAAYETMCAASCRVVALLDDLIGATDQGA